MGKRRAPAHSGVLRVDKPAGVTSHDVVRVIRRGFGQREVGHTGTLDPMATGLMLITLGRATRLGRFLEATQKVYVGRTVLGAATDTYDAEGQVTATADVPPLDEARIDRMLSALVGPLEQQVPAFSAVKVDGERLHAKARRGEVVEAPRRTIIIHRLIRTGWASPALDFEVACSKGTYVRTLAVQMGEALGLPAHLGALRRTQVGPHRVDGAPAPEAAGPEHLLSMADALVHVPRLGLDEAATTDVRHGRPLTVGQLAAAAPTSELDADALVALLDPAGDLVAMAHLEAPSRAWTERPPRERGLRYACVLSA